MTNAYEVRESLKLVLNKFGRLDVLINNAANNPKVESNGGTNRSRFENYPMPVWQQDVVVGLPDEEQPVKPVSYSVLKANLIGLIKYLASYWAEQNVRVKSISPGGIYVSQQPDFVKKLTNLIPMGRMAEKDEYKAVALFLISDASLYMTSANFVVDGGRICW